VATRKAALRLKSGARVTLVAPALCETAGQLVERGEVLHVPARFSAGHLRGMVLAIAATDDAAVNEEVSKAANALHLPVNVVDSPQLCSFVMPSIVDRSPVIVAIGSSGKAPVLARLLRTRLEGWIPQAYGKLAALAGSFREQAKQRFADVDARRRFWESVFEGPSRKWFSPAVRRPRGMRCSTCSTEASAKRTASARSIWWAPDPAARTC